LTTARVSRASGRGATADAIIALVVFAAATAAGVRSVQQFRAAGGVPEFYQSQFGPAVMIACGRGFQNPDASTIAPLAAFLAQSTDSFSCRDLPARTPTAAVSPFQASGRYLQAAAGLTWRLTGVSWTRLAILNGILFGLVAALTFGILRLALGRAWSLALLLPAALSSPNLTLVPQLRDYAKGPFLLAIVLVLGAMVLHAKTARAAIAGAAAVGLLLGTGLGFRTDLMIAAVPCVAAVAFLLPASVGAVPRVLALATMAAVAVAAGAPALRGYAAGGNTGHVVLLGLGGGFDRALRVEPSIYELVPQYNESLAFSFVNGFAARARAQPRGAGLSTAEYDRLSVAYLAAIAGTFPADLLTRAASAMRVVPRYFLDSSLAAPAWIASPAVDAFYRARGALASRVAWFAVPAAAAAILGTALVEPRAAWLMAIVYATFAGGAAIQFHERHFYYLQFVPWLAFGMVGQYGLSLPSLAGASARHRSDMIPALAMTAAAAAGVGAMAAARSLQQGRVTRLLESYETAARTPYAVSRRIDRGGIVLSAAPWKAPMPAGAPRVATTFIGVRLAHDRCPGRVRVGVRYQSPFADADLSHAIDVDLASPAGADTLIVMPVYDRADESIRFRELELTPASADCVRAVERIDGLSHEPIAVDATLGPAWKSRTLYQRMR
jgi:hypothetical protein